MPKEKPEEELTRLRNEREKTRRDQVFGGLSPAERAEYYRTLDRIRELQSKLEASAVAEMISESAKAEQRLQWNKRSETDTNQVEARQPYRNREKESPDNSPARLARNNPNKSTRIE